MKLAELKAVEKQLEAFVEDFIIAKDKKNILCVDTAPLVDARHVLTTNTGAPQHSPSARLVETFWYGSSRHRRGAQYRSATCIFPRHLSAKYRVVFEYVYESYSDRETSM